MTIALLRRPALPLYSCILFFLLPIRAKAQPAKTDSIIRSFAYSGALQVYHRSLRPATGLYNGFQYVDYAYTIKAGHPFFGDDHMQKGSVFYDGVLYGDINLEYDLVNEQVVIDDPYHTYKISLINGRLDRFTIRDHLTAPDHLFIHFSDSIDASAPHPGFYEQLYGGEKVSLFKKEKKTIQEETPSVTEGIRRYITHSIAYYLLLGTVWHFVDSRRDLLRAMKNRSGDLKKFLRANGLDLKKDKEQALIRATAWYDGFKP